MSSVNKELELEERKESKKMEFATRETSSRKLKGSSSRMWASSRPINLRRNSKLVQSQVKFQYLLREGSVCHPLPHRSNSG